MSDEDRLYAEECAERAEEALYAAHRDHMASDVMVSTTNALLAIYYVLVDINEKLGLPK